MDLSAARAALPVMTHAAFGVPCDILPMKEGKMGAAQADPARVMQESVMGRFDAAPSIEQLGGGRSVVTHSKFVSAHATISFAVAALSWMPVEGDQVRKSGGTDLYRISYVFAPITGNIVCALSRA